MCPECIENVFKWSPRLSKSLNYHSSFICTMVKRETQGMGGHTSVSNKPEESLVAKEEEFFVEKPVSEQPSGGKNGGANKTNPDGTELVPGHVKTMAALEPIFTAPDTSQLRDIGEASFGVAAETVHGTDDRIQITNTAIYPWRVHASLLITAADNSQWIGTGWFIGPHTLMTAGHVVHIKNSGVAGRDGWVKSITVMPGRNGSSLPYGAVRSNNFRSVTGWTNDGNENYDYGAILLSTDLGNTTGWLGFGAYSDADLIASTGNISGYPGDKPSGTQWYDHHKVASVNPRKVYYDIDTFGGQSGSAVYRIINGNRYGIAIHAYGGSTTNSGTRIVTPVFNNMVAWKA
jgi:glutamyl endopeptidase